MRFGSNAHETGETHRGAQLVDDVGDVELGMKLEASDDDGMARLAKSNTNKAMRCVHLSEDTIRSKVCKLLRCIHLLSSALLQSMQSHTG